MTYRQEGPAEKDDSKAKKLIAGIFLIVLILAGAGYYMLNGNPFAPAAQEQTQ